MEYNFMEQFILYCKEMNSFRTKYPTNFRAENIIHFQAIHVYLKQEERIFS